MADLIARGPGADHEWRLSLPVEAVTLGRVPSKCQWATPWDAGISSLHATMIWRDDCLFVRRLETGRNPVFFLGEDQTFQEFAVRIGESFVIGQTTFTLVESPPPPEDVTPDIEMTCTREELRLFSYADAKDRIEVLASLPELIRYSPSNDELERRVVEVLLRGMPGAVTAAVITLNGADDEDPVVDVRTVLHAGQDPVSFEPSRRLVTDAIHSRRQSVSYLWAANQAEQQSEYTVQAGLDWALCVPLPDDPSPGWGLYVTGSRPAVLPEGVSLEVLLKSDLKFAELVSDMFGALRQVSDLQRRHAQLARFLSRPVLSEIARRDIDEVLLPRDVEVAVLFCDLRGSCLLSEEGKGDLKSLWGRISAALGIMTSNITDLDGVIGDFQGDAAMGFWGWPLACPDAIQRAARAALCIRRDFQRHALEPGNPLGKIATGIGIASGPAFAGRLGTYDQFKVGVFGPVVNLAARLESMTKLLQVPILVDERSAEYLAGIRGTGWGRCRKVARVLPVGMTTPETVSELLPPVVEPGAMPERDRLNYEAALAAFTRGRWTDAERLLRLLPAEDGPTRFLWRQMEGSSGPPSDWDGVVRLGSK